MPPKRAATHSNYIPPAYDLSDDDDLDELVDDIDVDTKPETGGNDALRGSLKKPRYSIMTCKQIHDMLHQEIININAEYQRDVVWPASKQSSLIQSFFMNYYIPPVIFDTKIDESGNEIRTCIDGKQRLTSIQKFMDGEIPFITQERREKFYYRLGQNRGRQLPDHLRRRFDMLDVQSVEYDNLADKQQRDIFQRVQMGVALSAPEKLQAIPGPWPKWIIELQKKYITEEGGLADSIHIDTTRARAFQALTAFLMLAVDAARRSSPTYASMGTFLERTDGPDPAFKGRVQTTLSLLVRIASELHDEAFLRPPQRVAPVETWFICLLIYTRMTFFSIDRLAKSIAEMRTYIRQRYIDIRANGKVISDLHSFLAQLDKKRSDVPAADEYDMNEDDPRVARANKRSRRAEEADPSYEGPAIPRFERSDVVGGTRAQQASAAAQTRQAQGPAQAAHNMSYQPKAPALASGQAYGGAAPGPAYQQPQPQAAGSRWQYSS